MHKIDNAGELLTATIIAGVDEAGRGPLAGPVFAAAVILDPGQPIAGLADSKSISEKKRERLSDEIMHKAMAWAIACANVAEIDELNILRATLLAMRRCIHQLNIRPDLVLVDGLHCPEIDFPVRAVVKGDATIPSISAASIIAKVARDREMVDLDRQYPGYGLALHKGYPTRMHIQALEQLGITPIHRCSFAPVKNLLRSPV